MVKFGALSGAVKAAIIGVGAIVIVGGGSIPFIVHNNNVKAEQAVVQAQQQKEEETKLAEAKKAEEERLQEEARLAAPVEFVNTDFQAKLAKSMGKDTLTVGDLETIEELTFTGDENIIVNEESDYVLNHDITIEKVTTIGSSYYEKTIYGAPNGYTITYADETTKDFDKRGKIDNLSDLKSFKNLTALAIVYSDITNMQELSDIIAGSAITRLDLPGTNVDDSMMKIISGIKTIKELSLSDTSITDFSSIASLTGLTSLNLYNCGLTDISFMSGLTELKDVVISENNISDISPLAKMKKLEKLRANNNSIASLEALANKPELQEVSVSPNSVSFGDKDMAAIAASSKLKTINIDGREVSDISFAASMPGLENFRFDYGCKVTDASSLKNCKKLTSISFYEANLTDISFLSEHTDLKELYLSMNEGVTDISSLAGLSKLERLELSGTGISDISALANKPELSYVNVGNPVLDMGRVSDLSPLKDSVKLKTFRAYDNSAITDISIMASMPELEDVNIGGTGVKDLSPLKNAVKLKQLLIFDTPVTDISVVANMKALEVLRAQRVNADMSPASHVKEIVQ